MSSPPGVQPNSARADYSRMNPLTYSDRTGETAIRNLLNGGGPFQITAENGFRIFANRASLEYMLLGMEARVSRGGQLWVDPTEAQKTPTAEKFGDYSCRGSNTNIQNV